MAIRNNLGTKFIKFYVINIRTEKKCGYIK